MEKEIKKTGTTIVGLCAKDSVILAADKRVTLAGRIVVDKKFKKIYKVNDNLLIAMTGSVSDAQLLGRFLRANLKLTELRRNKAHSVKESVNFLANILYGSARQYIPSVVEFLVAGRDGEGAHLYSIGMDGSVIKFDDYSTDGSGMMYATGTLESNYRRNMNSPDAIKLAVQAVNAAIQRDAASGNGIEVYEVTKSGIKEVFNKDNQMDISA
ncbi:proteasome subunit beta [Candidatus Woesearchaeota archaeon]|nr:proteasome subunit beta [Candidatus Woesearchaeota archaeon]